MEHGLYLTIEKITNKLAYEKGCIIDDIDHYTGDIETAVFPLEIPFGEDKGKLEYYDYLRAMEFKDFIKKCFTILPRDNLMQLSNGEINGTGVAVDTLLSDDTCTEEERTKQKLIIYKFLLISYFAGAIEFFVPFKDLKTGEQKYAFELDEPIPTTYKKLFYFKENDD